MTDAKQERVLKGLHKGHAIRRLDLSTYTRPMHGKWRIAIAEPTGILRARLIWHLTRILPYLGNAELTVLGRAAYNLDRDTSTHHLKLMERLASLKGYPLDTRSAYRHFSENIRPVVIARLDRALDVPDHELRKVLELEREFAERVKRESVRDARDLVPSRQFRSPAHADLSRVIRTIYTSPIAASVEVLLRSQVIVAEASTRGLIVTQTTRAGYWVSAFSDSDLLRAHAEAAGLPWKGWSALVGADLIRRVASLSTPVGVIINPPASTTGDISQTLPLPAETVRAIAKRL
jgi:hypothetical protein